MIMLLDFVGIVIELIMTCISCRIIGGRHDLFTRKSLLALTAAFVIKFVTIFNPVILINSSATVLSVFVIAFFVYEIPILKILLIESVFLSLFYAADFITAALMMRIFNDSYLQMTENPAYRITGVFLSITISYSMILAASFILRKKIKDLPLRYWVAVVLCPTLSYASLLMTDTILMHSDITNPIFIILPAIALIYINFILFDFFETYSKRIEYEGMKMVEEQNKENYKILEESETDLRILRHDLKNHMNIIDSLSSNGDIEEVRKYITSMKDSVESASYIYTKNQVLDSIINIKARKARNNNIHFTVKAEENMDIQINPMDMVTILSNALDNAIEGSHHINDAFIEVDVHENNGFIVMSVKNPADEPILSDGGYKTSKADDKNHGLGLKSMQKVIKKYNGDMRAEYTDGIFNLDIFVQNMPFVTV